MRGHGVKDLSLYLRGFLHNFTVGTHLLAQNLSKSSNLDSRHEQMNSSVFCFLWYIFNFLLCFVVNFGWVFFCLFRVLAGGSGFGGVFRKGGVISVWMKRQKQSSVCKKCFVAWRHSFVCALQGVSV